MLKKKFCWAAWTLIFISLLSEAIYRLLSMKTSEAALGKDCIVLVLGAVHEFADWIRDALFYRESEDNAPLCRPISSNESFNSGIMP